jgi:predicted outer membrane protein
MIYRADFLPARFHFMEVRMNARPGFTRLLAICLLAGASAPAAAQTSSDANVAPVAASKQAREIARGDPVRWYREDTTSAQRMKTRQKEIGAALDEARNACRQGPPAERPACLKAAQETWRQEMTALRAEAPVQAGT